ncbi:class I SAM-dependent methyltransferase [Dinghuibacter silviterrae]|uniref:Methyltransferase family protein n=1 Tax=Dinghuibacter silviterrae TaxID=1539049 RepID=A0A4R8DR06_9BACT|nr:class I SAM-dependent methyltransferase [Dinghuibacter silviterrae]TDX00256.1 methyltransferase family protein [Dinghuibacter silviterrae]
MKRMFQKANTFIKDLSYASRVGLLLAPFRHLFRFLLNFSLISSWINKHSGKIAFSDFYRPFRNYEDRVKLHEYIVRQEGLEQKPIHYFEFGVAGGYSFKWWLNACKNNDSAFFGFDTFEGLPENWHFYKKGDMAYDAPTLEDKRARFIKGLFQESVPPFLEEYRDHFMKAPVTRVLHLDADLYTSTLFALTAMAPYLRNGDIIMFDEFNVPNHEFAAWTEFVKCYYIKYEVLGAVNNFYQTCFKVIK